MGQTPITTKNQAIWAAVVNKIYFSDKFYLSNEFHLRRANWGLSAEQIIERPALNYDFAKFITGSIGYSFVLNDPYGTIPAPLPTLEHNIWEQIVLKHKLEKLSFKHRYRIEHRFVQRIGQDANQSYYIDGFQFRQRFRYRFTLNYTLKSFKDQQAKLFIQAFDELFLNINSPQTTAPIFNQNWIYIGLGYAFNPHGNIQLGYMNQSFQRNASWFENNHNIVLSFSYNIHLKKPLKKPTN
ncbi:DUF2490 domain-containing protein [Aureispira anguillae]|nr:DUF2490 domain-containing protein [Aureispira anguillae]